MALLRRQLLGALLPLTLAACSGPTATVRDFAGEAGAAPRADMAVAVLPFENLSAHPHAGQILAQLIAAELYSRGLFAQVEESEVRRRLAQRGLEGKELGRDTVARELAEAIAVDAVLVGSVQDFGYRYGLRPDPVVAATARLVARDGNVLWGGSFAESGGMFGGADSATVAAQRLAASIADRLAARSAKR
jgi:polysaccharide biosynthesis protein PelC